MRGRARRGSDERGAAVVELALVAGLFFFIVFAAIDFSYAYSIRSDMIHAAQEGLRSALVQTTDSSRDSTATTTAQLRMIGVVGQARAQSKGAAPCGGTNNGGALDVCTDFSGGTFPACTNNASPPVAIPNTECETITLTYDYRDNSVVNIPGISLLMPAQIHVSVTQQVK